MGKSIHPFAFTPQTLNLTGPRTTFGATYADSGGHSSWSEQPRTSVCAPTPNALLIPSLRIVTFFSSATRQDATPVVSCLWYAPSALRMNPPRQESWADGAYGPSTHTTASITCLPGASFAS